MRLTATHTTTYLYSEPVSICDTVVHLEPYSGEGQKLISHKLEVTPEPAFTTMRPDYFGNRMRCFAIHQPHQTLTIRAESVVEVDPEDPPAAALTPAWEQVRDAVSGFPICEFTFASPLAAPSAEFRQYAEKSFAPGRSLLEAAQDLTHRIYADFKYDPRATTVSTPVAEVLKCRHGVCQDYSHVMIACLRSMGLAARYVSGYLRSGEKTRGAEASHAWCAAYCPGFGWLEFDPTNNVMPHADHLRIAWGRDYSDVAPVRGVAVGGGEQLINVSVSVV
jgi:transglutaminase-like putative cysteine protease